jgi:hypothetical protein
MAGAAAALVFGLSAEILDYLEETGLVKWAVSG